MKTETKTRATGDLFESILNEISEIDYREKALNYAQNDKITNRHYIVVTIEELIRISEKVAFDVMQKDESIFIFNGEYWIQVPPQEFKSFLGKAALKMGVPYIDGKYYGFIDGLYKQFFASAKIQALKSEEGVHINLRNGTFKFTSQDFSLNPFDKNDFLTYQLPFEFDKHAEAPMFKNYLNRVLPDGNLQDILAEFIGYIFVKKLKLEKCLLLYGNGANGKSVFFDIINAMLGRENITNFTLGSLSEEHNRAMIANKLLNYGSELKGNMDADIFKQLVSNEPIHCRFKYGNPFICEDYAKLVFNCNELPKQAEVTPAYFRRFLIVPFDIIIPENERDPELAQKIIRSELPGIFNWVLSGLERILRSKKFTSSEKTQLALEEYKHDSDSVASFITEEGYSVSKSTGQPLKSLYESYRTFCNDEGRRILSRTSFSRRLKNLGFESTRQNIGMVVFINRKEKVFPETTRNAYSSRNLVIRYNNVEGEECVDVEKLFS